MLDHGAPPQSRTTPSPPSPGTGARLMRRKPVERLVAEGGKGDGGSLRRSLGLWQLTMISIGATLGTGIFVVLGEAVPKAGPAVTLSFVIAGLTALFSALSYAELAGTIPVAGSSYSYAYATMGELIAWICGWCLVLEYGVSVAAVAVGWGEYLNELLDGTIGVTIPDALSAPPGDGGVFNLPALDRGAARHGLPARRRQGVRARQHHHGDREDRRAGDVLRHRRPGLPLRQLRALHAARHGGRQRRRCHASSSPTSASTPPPPPARRPRTRSATCRARSCSRWSS